MIKSGAQFSSSHPDVPFLLPNTSSAGSRINTEGGDED